MRNHESSNTKSNLPWYIWWWYEWSYKRSLRNVLLFFFFLQMWTSHRNVLLYVVKEGQTNFNTSKVWQKCRQKDNDAIKIVRENKQWYHCREWQNSKCTWILCGYICLKNYIMFTSFFSFSLWCIILLC